MPKTKRQIGKLSKDKGKRGEREVVDLLKLYGFKARRGQQYAGGPFSPDIVHNMKGFHIEVKRTEKLSLYKALDQAQADKAEHETPIVFHRPSQRDWVVIMPAWRFLGLMKELYDD